MNTNWLANAFVSTEETTTFLHEDQLSFELWTIVTTETGNIVPERLSNQVASSFEEAVANWVELLGEQERFDSLSMTYNGFPVVPSRDEALKVVQQLSFNLY
ncbi:hypothetical protein [Pseudoalteromonas umbrosa]|uniref:hypothetical protein n=1 Tax=Pseudoalteromonas umbrosa TaxID=3048489 RepID=UPI0024C41A84|nr:hypothetical protein [Pseudoalteromonas sp. B95]MDK1290166.1 hypothetical protein [Pseudoalteromonas sp. B95]